MSFNVLNPWLLYALLGVSLPILAHLLSRKKYDVVQWGAMQFLELGRKARRRIRLEQLLLLLLRMGLIALVVLALARPWVQGGFLAELVSTQSRDVVIVIDGSYSMGWKGGARTPHDDARQWVHRFLEDLNSGDTVSIIDARDRARVVIDPPTRDFSLVRETVDSLPPPSGTSNLAEACTKAVQILSRTSHLARDCVVLTDGQARGWSADDEHLWAGFDDLRTQPAVQTRLWVVDLDPHKGGQPTNFAVDRLSVSRELTVTRFPVRIKTKVRYHGEQPLSRRVYLEINGQRLAEQTQTYQFQPAGRMGGEVTVEFEHRFARPGSHVVSVVLDDDNLPGDDRADAAISVAESIPVLLVDGDPRLDPIRSETALARAALSPSNNPAPLVRAEVVAASDLTSDRLATYEAVVLANVPGLDDPLAAALKDYVATGRGLFIALGDRVDPARYNAALHEDGRGLLPVRLVSIAEDAARDRGGARIANDSLDLPWTQMFRAEHGGDLTQARFMSWWKTEPPPLVGARVSRPGPREQASGAANLGPAAGRPPGPAEAGPGERGHGPAVSSPIVAARLDTGEPLIVTRNYGRGAVLVMTAPIDADWSTLPARDDFVTLLHEVVLFLSSQRSARNVDVGVPLILDLPASADVRQFAFFGPGKTAFAVTPAGNELRPAARLADTSLPGVYEFRAKNAPGGVASAAGPREHFVVNFDRGESDLTPLDDDDRRQLAGDGRLAFVKSRDELRQLLFTDDSRSEFGLLLLFVFLGMLVFEVVMCRRLVRGGHEAVEEPESAAEPV
ncbi:MAG TPA: VWA domain-containing protein [Planctomycetaceae bacterium]|nr:VWA domain-containing protein [Planctomycetaceae bacterium]